MADITYIEREFVKEDVSVFAEFDNSNFINNAKIAIGGKIEEATSVSRIHHYGDMLEKAIASVKDAQLRLDKSELNAVTNKMVAIAASGADFRVPYIENNEFTYVKPQYLGQFTEIITNMITRVVDGDADKSEVDTLLINKVDEVVKKQVVKSTYMPVKNSFELIKFTLKKSDEVLTQKYIESKWTPFVSLFSSRYEKKMTNAEAVLRSIRETENSINSILAAANKIRTDGEHDITTIKKMNYVVYYGIRSLMDVCSYITFMMIRDINTFLMNITAVDDCCVRVSNYTGHEEDNVASEAFEDVFQNDTHSLSDSLLNGDVSAFDALANNIANFYDVGDASTALNDVNSQVSEEIQDAEINKDNSQEEKYGNTLIYDDVVNAYNSIHRGLDVLSARSDDFLLVFDDVIADAGFGVRLQDRFSNLVNRIMDLGNIDSILASSEGIDQIALKEAILKEVKEYPNRMEKIAKAASDVKIEADMLKKRFSENINGEFKDAESINELNIFMQEFLDQLSELTNLIASKLYARLVKFGNILSEISKPNEGDNTSPETVLDADVDHTDYHRDYSECVFEQELADLQEEVKNNFHALERQYFIDRALSLRNVNLVLEAEGDDTTSTSPKVVDNDVQPAAGQQNTTDPTQQNNGVLAKVAQVIQKMIDGFVEYINKASGKNEKWIAENKQELLNRSYNNVSVQIVPYNRIKPEAILGDIQKLTNAVNAITPQNLQAFNSEDDAYQKMFTFVSGGVHSGGTDVKTQVTNYYKMGNSTEAVKLVPVANGELKNQVTNDMIPYCEAFYSNFTDSVKNSLKKLADTTDAMLAKANATSTPNEDAQKNTQGNMSAKAKWVSSAVQYYSAAVLNTIRDRNVDYLKVLSSLTPKTPQKPAQPQQQA